MDFLGVGLRPPIYLASRISFQLRGDKNTQVDVIYTDFSKAFDRIIISY
jgi:hypothetical protein